MLDITAISQWRLNFNCREIDLNDVITKITRKFNHHVSYQGMPIIVYLDPSRIEQLVTNLITNGIKYGKNKPIEVELHAADAKQFQLIVKDHGIGIAGEDKERIFHKFERINHRGTINGLGLCLYVVKQIVTAQGGTIVVDSKIGSGSTFTITLPLRIAGESSKCTQNLSS
ncbi:MAG: sensor histidine kinase [Legionella sp.]